MAKQNLGNNCKMFAGALMHIWSRLCVFIWSTSLIKVIIRINKLQLCYLKIIYKCIMDRSKLINVMWGR